MFRALARTIVPAPVRRWLRHAQSVSKQCQIIDSFAAAQLQSGWSNQHVAQSQHKVFSSLLQQLRAGQVRTDFAVLAAAVKATGLDDPLVVEVGCGSGWNSEVLTLLTGRLIHYIGMDCSSAMIALGKRDYPAAQFITGDATTLPFRDGACDILVSGTVLMHLMNYQAAIAESRRVTRRWCIFHTVPIARKRRTTILRKRAYGSPVAEIVFNEQELLELFAANGLAVRETFPSIPHDYLNTLMGEPIQAWTYLCEIR